MQPDRLSDEQLDDLAAELAPRLPTGTHGDHVILRRRQFIGAMGGTVGAGALMALGVDRAAAEAAGQQGTADDPNDMFAWDLDVANEVTSDVDMAGNDLAGVGSFSTDNIEIDGSVHYAADDDDLDDILSMASGGELIILGPADFTDSRTVDTEVSIMGLGGARVPLNGTRINEASWTFNERVDVESVYVRDTILTVNDRASFRNLTLSVGDAEIDVASDRVLIDTIAGSGAVTFQSGTERGVIGTRDPDINVTDNGTNNVMPLS